MNLAWFQFHQDIVVQGPADLPLSDSKLFDICVFSLDLQIQFSGRLIIYDGSNTAVEVLSSLGDLRQTLFKTSNDFSIFHTRHIFEMLNRQIHCITQGTISFLDLRVIALVKAAGPDYRAH